MKIEIKISKINLNQFNFWEFSMLTRELGNLFGYPDCCIDFYVQCWRDHIFNPPKWNEKEPNYVFYSYKNTKNKNKINFLLNNRSVYRLISHFPCSYECKKSLDFAKKLFDNLPEKQRKLAEKALKRDILVWNEENALEKGDKLENSKNYVKIFRNDQLIFKYNKKPPEECFILCFC